MIELILITYLALLATVLWHELGHVPQKLKIVQWFPWPEAHAFNAKYRFGGLILNFVGLFFVYLYKPEMYFLLLFGLFNWLHLILYSIFGSINLEIKYPKWMKGNIILDDVPNKYAIIFIPFGIAIFWIFREFYIPILLNNWFALMLTGYIVFKSIGELRK